MKVLITGASGFIGAQVLDYFLENTDLNSAVCLRVRLGSSFLQQLGSVLAQV